MAPVPPEFAAVKLRRSLPPTPPAAPPAPAAPEFAAVKLRRSQAPTPPAAGQSPLTSAATPTPAAVVTAEAADASSGEEESSEYETEDEPAAPPPTLGMAPMPPEFAAVKLRRSLPPTPPAAPPAPAAPEFAAVKLRRSQAPAPLAGPGPAVMIPALADVLSEEEASSDYETGDELPLPAPPVVPAPKPGRAPELKPSLPPREENGGGDGGGDGDDGGGGGGDDNDHDGDEPPPAPPTAPAPKPPSAQARVPTAVESAGESSEYDTEDEPPAPPTVPPPGPPRQVDGTEEEEDDDDDDDDDDDEPPPPAIPAPIPTRVLAPTYDLAKASMGGREDSKLGDESNPLQGFLDGAKRAVQVVGDSMNWMGDAVGRLGAPLVGLKVTPEAASAWQAAPVPPALRPRRTVNVDSKIELEGPGRDLVREVDARQSLRKVSTQQEEPTSKPINWSQVELPVPSGRDPHWDIDGFEAWADKHASFVTVGFLRRLRAVGDRVPVTLDAVDPKYVYRGAPKGEAQRQQLFAVLADRRTVAGQ